MSLSENLYFIILFTLPAALHIIYHSYIRIVPRKQEDKSIELAECVIFCAIVFFINILILNNRLYDFAKYTLLSEIDKSKSNFNYLGFMIEYFIVNLATSILTIAFWYKFGIKLFRKIVNWVNKVDNRSEELEFTDVWKNIFESNKLLNKYDTCLVIEQGGNRITAGILQTHQPPDKDNKELLLYQTEQVQEVLEEDKTKLPEYKIFYPALYEYYDVQNELLIKFYSLDNYKRYKLKITD